MPTVHGPNVPTIRTTGSPYFGGNVAVNGSDWMSDIGAIAARVGSGLFADQREQEESRARVGLLEAQREGQVAETKDRVDVMTSRIAGRTAIEELFGQVGPAPDESTPPEERERWGFTANQASEAVINAIARGTIDANEAVATLAMLFNPAGDGPVGMTEEDRRRGNFGVDLADGNVNENNVFSETQGQDRFETMEANDIRQANISAGGTIEAARIGAESRERVADVRGTGGGGGAASVQNQGRALSAAQRAFLTARGRPNEAQLQAMEPRAARLARQETAQLLRDNQIAIGRLADAYSAPTYNAAEFSAFARALAANPNAPTPAAFEGRGNAPAGGTPPAAAVSGGGGRSPPAAPARRQSSAPSGRIPGPAFDAQGNPNVGVDDEGNLIYIPTGDIVTPAAQRR